MRPPKGEFVPSWRKKAGSSPRSRGSSQRGQTQVSQRGQAEVSQRGQAEVSQRGQTEVSQRGQAEVSQRGQTQVSQRGQEKAEVSQRGQTQVSQRGQEKAEVQPRKVTSQRPLKPKGPTPTRARQVVPTRRPIALKKDPNLIAVSARVKITYDPVDGYNPYEFGQLQEIVKIVGEDLSLEGRTQPNHFMVEPVWGVISPYGQYHKPPREIIHVYTNWKIFMRTGLNEIKQKIVDLLYGSFEPYVSNLEVVELDPAQIPFGDDILYFDLLEE